MAATGYTPIQLYRSATASAAPLAANLSNGELAINYNDGTLYYKDSSGVVKVLARQSPISGYGTADFIPKFTTSSTIDDSIIQDNGVGVGIGRGPQIYYSLAVDDGIQVGNVVEIVSNTASLTFSNPSLSNSFYITSSYASDLSFIAGSSTRMFIDNLGKVKIGTGSPSELLDVGGNAIFNGNATAAAFIPLGSTVPSNGMYSSAANTLNFATNATNRFSINSSGNAFFTGVVNLVSAVASGSISATGNVSGAALIPSGSTVPANGMYLSAANTLDFATNTTNRLSISSTGDATFSGTATAAALIPTGSTVPANGMYLSGANTLNFATNTINRFSISATGLASFGSSVSATALIATGSTVPSNGMYLSAANTLSFATNTTNRLSINSVGTAAFTGSVTAGSVTTTGTITGTALIPSGATVPANGMYLSAANTLDFSTNTTNRLSISSAGAATFSGSVSAASVSATGAVSAASVSATGNATAAAIIPSGATVPTNGMYLSAANTLNLATNTTNRVTIDSSGNMGIGQASPAAVLHLKAGTATANTAPLKLTSGTNLTNAEGGAFEYDGKVAYFTPQVSQRGVVPAVQFLIQTTNYTQPSNIVANTAFQLFSVTGAGNGLISLQNGTYSYECCFYMTALPTTAHTLQFGFNDTSGSNLASAFSSLGNIAASQNVNACSLGLTAVTTDLVDVTAVVSTTASNTIVTVKGILVVSTDSSFQPTFKCSTGGTKPVTNAGSYISITPLGSSTVKAVGYWL